LAIFECMFDRIAEALVQRLGTAARAENRAAGERLAVIGELDLASLAASDAISVETSSLHGLLTSISTDRKITAVESMQKSAFDLTP
jgi:hypothetical protein